MEDEEAQVAVIERAVPPASFATTPAVSPAAEPAAADETPLVLRHESGFLAALAAAVAGTAMLAIILVEHVDLVCDTRRIRYI